MLNIFVPIIFPNAISNSSFLAATIVIVISGNDVPITTTVIVTTLVLKFKYSANNLALSTTKSLDNIITIQHAIVNNIDLTNLYFTQPLNSHFEGIPE